jgi:hypothetical protein
MRGSWLIFEVEKMWIRGWDRWFLIRKGEVEFTEILWEQGSDQRALTLIYF